VTVLLEYFDFFTNVCIKAGSWVINKGQGRYLNTRGGAAQFAEQELTRLVACKRNVNISCYNVVQLVHKCIMEIDALASIRTFMVLLEPMPRAPYQGGAWDKVPQLPPPVGSPDYLYF